MDSKQKPQSLAALLAGIFGAVASQSEGGNKDVSSQIVDYVDESKQPKPGQVTSEGMAGPVASVKEDSGSITSDGSDEPWQSKLAQTIEDSALKAVGKRTTDMITTGQADPAQILEQANQTKMGIMTGQQAFQAAQQNSGIDPAVIQQIQNAAPKVTSGLMDNMFQTPAYFGHRAALEAAGQVGPTVMQNYMTEQLPLGTRTKAELAANAWQAQMNAQLGVLDKIGTLRSHLAPVIEAERKMQPWFGIPTVWGGKSKALKGALKKATAFQPEAEETIAGASELAQSHPNMPRAGRSSAESIKENVKSIAYKAGETRQINGVTYKRGEGGTWKRQ
jgi:hypothetical protein